jgi:hypothetical protein
VFTISEAEGIYTDIRTAFPAAHVNLRVRGKTIVALSRAPSSSNRFAMFGMDADHQGSLLVLKSELPQDRIDPGETVETQDGARWTAKRVNTVDVIGGAVLRLNMVSEYQA